MVATLLLYLGRLRRLEITPKVTFEDGVRWSWNSGMCDDSSERLTTMNKRMCMGTRGRWRDGYRLARRHKDTRETESGQKGEGEGEREGGRETIAHFDSPL